MNFTVLHTPEYDHKGNLNVQIHSVFSVTGMNLVHKWGEEHLTICEGQSRGICLIDCWPKPSKYSELKLRVRQNINFDNLQLHGLGH